MTKIALFFGGKISQHLVLVKKAATRLRQGYGGQDKIDVELDLISYNRVSFDTESGQIIIRDHISSEKEIHKKAKDLNDYGVIFFRTTGKHWEEVNLVLDSVSENIKSGKTIVVDPLVSIGRPSDACKAWQMLALKKEGIEVPKTIYGSLWYLYELMGADTSVCPYSFPVILKGSGGDRGTRVYKADNLEELEKLVRDLRKSETEEGRRYMLQEYIPNDGDYRVLVLGEKVLGVMKRSSQSKSEFKNNYSAGGKVEVADLPEEIKQLSIRAARACGLAVAGVDVMAKSLSSRDCGTHLPLTKGRNIMSNNPKDYVILEVNKGPQFKGFMKATGIDVPAEIIKFLVSLKN